ncbi:type 1 glutamine amidotransferase family protein [Virgibacillus senegalensis]|uniref:hypothetical protein n=1 Tax=Virgibacillus senegalensis TaxID=1499679 RepID=UPI00069E5B01|nr:hypothetical protein [Virgibacillus senegalensis]
MFDAVYAAGGEENKAFYKQAAYFVMEAFSHYKTIGATHEGRKLLEANGMEDSPGVVQPGLPSGSAKRPQNIAIGTERFYKADSDLEGNSPPG